MGDRTPALEAVFKPVQPPTTFEETVERLGTAIRLGCFPQVAAARARPRGPAPHLPLDPAPGADHAGAERPPGLPTRARRRHPRGGRPTTLHATGRGSLGDDARAVLDERVAVETGATVLAAERAEAGDLDVLDQLVERMAAADSFEEYRRADMRFHIGVAEAAHSPRLVTAMTEVQGTWSELITRIAHPEEVLTRSNGQHRRLVSSAPRRGRPRGPPDARAQRGPSTSWRV